MNIATAPIAASTSLSILLHGAVVAVLLVVYNQTSPEAAVGQGLAIELVSSITVSDQHEAERLQKQLPEPFPQEKVSNVSNVKKHKENLKTNARIMTALRGEHRVSNGELAHKKMIEQLFDEDESEVEPQRQSQSEKNSKTAVNRSTDASQQRHSILELLHSSISNNKEYPYMARRQRREGTSRVAFVLHPDGTVENTHLIRSSQTVSLDRAAISAVEDIEPFKAAQDYLDRAQEFQVEVVFNLL